MKWIADKIKSSTQWKLEAEVRNPGGEPLEIVRRLFVVSHYSWARGSFYHAQWTPELGELHTGIILHTSIIPGQALASLRGSSAI
jgi:hypothetical protein